MQESGESEGEPAAVACYTARIELVGGLEVSANMSEHELPEAEPRHIDATSRY